MFVISNGMPKSGSTLLMRYTRYLLINEFGNKGQEALLHWIKNGPVGGVGVFPWEGWENHINELEKISSQMAPFVLKTHIPLESLAKNICNNKNIKISYSIRDPRDIILSLIDHGERSRKVGNKVFSDIFDIDTALSNMKYWCENAIEWINTNDIETFRYEELIKYPFDQIKRLCNFLQINQKPGLIENIIELERKERFLGKFQFQYNKGLVSRFNEEMSKTEILKVNQFLNFYIEELGYKI